MRVASSAEMAEIDRRSQADYSIPGIVLMENAGSRALAAVRGEGLSEPVEVFRIVIDPEQAGDGAD